MRGKGEEALGVFCAEKGIPCAIEEEPALLKEGNVIGETLLPRKTPCFKNAMVQNVCIGHTQVYNRPMLSLLRAHYSADMFVIDHWAYIIATAFGRVIFDPSLVTLYRQHGSNAIGYGHSLISKIKGRSRRARAGVPQAHTRQLLALLAFDTELDPEKKRMLGRFLSARTRFFRRLLYLLHPDAYRDGFVENTGFRLLYLLGSYNESK